MFKQKLRPLLRHTDLLRKVSNFICKNKENIIVSEFLDIVIFYPENRKNFVETIQRLNPAVILDRNSTTTLTPSSASIEKVKLERKECSYNQFQPSSSIHNAATIQRILPDAKSDEDANDNDKDYGINKKNSKRKRSRRGSSKNKKRKIATVQQNQIFVSKRRFSFKFSLKDLLFHFIFIVIFF